MNSQQELVVLGQIPNEVPYAEGSQDGNLLTTLHLRVHGMMCQANCGTTVRQSLESIPGCTQASSSFENSYASLTVNLEEYYYRLNPSKSDMKFDADNKSLLDDLIPKVAQDAIDAVECVGFEAFLLEGGEDVEKCQSESNLCLKTSGMSWDDEHETSSSDLFSENDVGDDIQAIISLQVKGMSCAVCTGRVERALEQVGSCVERAVVSLSTSRATVRVAKDYFDRISSMIPEETEIVLSNEIAKIAEACSLSVKRAGYDCEVLEIYSPSDEVEGGMTLAENAAKLEEARQEELKSWANLLVFAAIFSTPLMAVHYTSMLGTASSQSVHEEKWMHWLSFCFATIVQFGVGKRYYIAAYHCFQNGRVMGMDFLVCLATSAAYLYSIIVLGISVLGFKDEAEKDGIHLKASFETPAMLLTFVTLGKFLEAYAKGKTASALQTLMQLQPVFATHCDIPESQKLVQEETGVESLSKSFTINGIQKEEIQVKHVKIGQYLLVIPGSRIPTDGKIVYIDGKNTMCYIDESVFSGEPFPIAKAIGDAVYGSTVNQCSTLIIKVTATGTKTVISRIVRLIEEAQANKAPIQALADYVASLFVPCVLCISALTFIGWITLNRSVDAQDRFLVALMTTISVVVVACPCALGLATPTAVMVGTGVGAKHGILVKGGAVLENAHSVDTVIFDKTGTITTGKATLGERMEFMENANEDHPLLQGLPPKVNKHNLCLWLGACTEANSDHPLARAIVNGSKTAFGTDYTFSKDGVNVSQSSTVPGKGVEALVSRQDWGEWWVRVGKKSFVQSTHGLSEEDDEEELREMSLSRGGREIQYLRSQGHVGVYVSVRPESKAEDSSKYPLVIGILGILDAPKSNAKSTVLALKASGIDVWMCTGDHEETAQAIARAVGIEPENVCANVSPQGKADLVTRLQRRKRDLNSKLHGKKGKIAVVGDGINDSVALARADVGIAVGAGTEVAMEAANVVLVRSNLHDVFVVLHLSKFVFNRIKVNFIWAAGYNLFALPFAAGCFFPWTDWTVPPAFAGFMMAFSSVSVVTSSLLLKTYSKPVIHEDGSIQEYGCSSFPQNVPRMLYKFLTICPSCKGPVSRGWTSVETSQII